MHVFDIPVRVGIYNAASCCNGFSPVRGWRFSWLGFWARGAAIGGVLRVCLAIAVTMALDGPSRMVKRPTGSGGEPSSPNCRASAGIKARQLHCSHGWKAPRALCTKATCGNEQRYSKHKAASIALLPWMGSAAHTLHQGDLAARSNATANTKPLFHVAILKPFAYKATQHP